MCGINGFLDMKDICSKEQRHHIVHDMNNKIIHRGPDSEGIYDGKWFSMGMRRLSILDLDTGNQSIYNFNKTLVIVFNGEIYNYKKPKRITISIMK